MVLDEFAVLLFSCIFCMIVEKRREMERGSLGRSEKSPQQIAGEQLEPGVQCSRLHVQDIIPQPWIHGVDVPVLLGHFVSTVTL